MEYQKRVSLLRLQLENKLRIFVENYGHNDIVIDIEVFELLIPSSSGLIVTDLIHNFVRSDEGHYYGFDIFSLEDLALLLDYVENDLNYLLNIELLPIKVKNILYKFSEGDHTYDTLNKLNEEILIYGFEISYGLSAEIEALKKIK